jgi:hypothetical protein
MKHNTVIGTLVVQALADVAGPALLVILLLEAIMLLH